MLIAPPPLWLIATVAPKYLLGGETLKDGMMVFDAVVHAFDYRETVMVNDDAYFLKDFQAKYMTWTERNG